MKILNIIFCGILIIFPTFIFADWEEDRACLQTLICNVNGQFLKDNEDNRACMAKYVQAIKVQEDQDTDPPPMCLSQELIAANPNIDFNENRIEPIPLEIPPNVPNVPNVPNDNPAPPELAPFVIDLQRDDGEPVAAKDVPFQFFGIGPDLRGKDAQEEGLTFEIILPTNQPDLGEAGNPKNNIIRQEHLNNQRQQNKTLGIIPLNNEIQNIPQNNENQNIQQNNEIQIIQQKNLK
jgi:hypothetical protein